MTSEELDMVAFGMSEVEYAACGDIDPLIPFLKRPVKPCIVKLETLTPPRGKLSFH